MFQYSWFIIFFLLYFLLNYLFSFLDLEFLYSLIGMRMFQYSWFIIFFFLIFVKLSFFFLGFRIFYSLTGMRMIDLWLRNLSNLCYLNKQTSIGIVCFLCNGTQSSSSSEQALNHVVCSDVPLSFDWTSSLGLILQYLLWSTYFLHSI